MEELDAALSEMTSAASLPKVIVLLILLVWLLKFVELTSFCL